MYTTAFNYIEIIATICGILGTLWALIKFVFKPYFKRRDEYKFILNQVEESCKRWIELKYSGRGGTLISNENFLIANKYRSKFTLKSNEIRAFLLRNAIQNGLSGSWGNWLDMNKNNKQIIWPLIITLDESSGSRPMWRSSLILAQIFSNQIEKINDFIPDQIDKSRFNLRLIKKDEIEKELFTLNVSNNEDIKRKIGMVMDEYNRFSSMLDNFKQEQTILIRE